MAILLIYHPHIFNLQVAQRLWGRLSFDQKSVDMGRSPEPTAPEAKYSATVIYCLSPDIHTSLNEPILPVALKGRCRRLLDAHVSYHHTEAKSDMRARGECPDDGCL
jgi:hypothetical protein